MRSSGRVQVSRQRSRSRSRASRLLLKFWELTVGSHILTAVARASSRAQLCELPAEPTDLLIPRDSSSSLTLESLDLLDPRVGKEALRAVRDKNGPSAVHIRHSPAIGNVRLSASH